jgi:hypothetical protein
LKKTLNSEIVPVINGLSTSEPRTYFKNPIDEKESDKY